MTYCHDKEQHDRSTEDLRADLQRMTALAEKRQDELDKTLLQNDQIRRKMHQWERIVSAALAWDACGSGPDRLLRVLQDAINAYRADEVQANDLKREGEMLPPKANGCTCGGAPPHAWFCKAKV